jgi:hypothetical protein
LIKSWCGGPGGGLTSKIVKNDCETATKVDTASLGEFVAVLLYHTSRQDNGAALERIAIELLQQWRSHVIANLDKITMAAASLKCMLATIEAGSHKPFSLLSRGLFDACLMEMKKDVCLVACIHYFSVFKISVFHALAAPQGA